MSHADLLKLLAGQNIQILEDWTKCLKRISPPEASLIVGNGGTFHDKTKLTQIYLHEPPTLPFPMAKCTNFITLTFTIYEIKKKYNIEDNYHKYNIFFLLKASKCDNKIGLMTFVKGFDLHKTTP